MRIVTNCTTTWNNSLQDGSTTINLVARILVCALKNNYTYILDVRKYRTGALNRPHRHWSETRTHTLIIISWSSSIHHHHHPHHSCLAGQSRYIIAPLCPRQKHASSITFRQHQNGIVLTEALRAALHNCTCMSARRKAHRRDILKNVEIYTQFDYI